MVWRPSDHCGQYGGRRSDRVYYVCDSDPYVPHDGFHDLYPGIPCDGIFRRILEVLDTKVDLNDEEASMTDKKVEKGEIEFRHVGFRYYKKHKNMCFRTLIFVAHGRSDRNHRIHRIPVRVLWYS